MEEAPENGKESSNYAHANGMNELRSYLAVPSELQISKCKMKKKI